MTDGKKVWMPRKGQEGVEGGLSMMDQSAKDQTLELLLGGEGADGAGLGRCW
jgi:hypothetical protein